MSALIFSTRSYQRFASSLAQLARLPVGEVERKEFPDGELFQNILDPVAGRDVVVVGGTTTAVDTLELYDLAYGVVAQGAQRLYVIIPYYGYSTMERAEEGKDGNIITAKTRADLLSSIPIAALGNRMFFLDLHVAGMENFLHNSQHPKHLYAEPIILSAIRSFGGDGDYKLGTTDTGRFKWVESYARQLGKGDVVSVKTRVSGSQVESRGFVGDVRDQHIIIYDDMIRTGGSLIEAAEGYRKAGARRVDVVATHGVFPGNAPQRILDSGAVDRIAVTDSHPRVYEFEGLVEIHSVAEVFVPYLPRS